MLWESNSEVAKEGVIRAYMRRSERSASSSDGTEAKPDRGRPSYVGSCAHSDYGYVEVRDDADCRIYQREE